MRTAKRTVTRFLVAIVVLVMCVSTFNMQFPWSVPSAFSPISRFAAWPKDLAPESASGPEAHVKAVQPRENPFEEPLPGLWLPKNISGFAVVHGSTVEDDSDHRLFYRSGTFYLFTDDSEGATHVLQRIVQPHTDYPFKVLPANERPKKSHRMEGTTWILLCPQQHAGLIGHYFHFMEFLVGLWPVDQLHRQQRGEDMSETTFTVTHIVLGPKLTRQQWQRPGETINAALLKALHPNATQWDAHNPLPFSEADPFWVSFDRAVIAERFATVQDELVQRTNKMDMAIAKWAMQHELPVWEGFKEAVLGRLCSGPGDCTAMPLSIAPPLLPFKENPLADCEFMSCHRKPNLTYVSRQRDASRRLRNNIAQELEFLLTTEWTSYFNTRIIYMQDLSPQEQIQIAAQTDILLGIHGNGLTHGFWMPKGGVIVEMLVQDACLWDFQVLAAVSGQSWVGVDSQGVMSPGNPGYCRFAGWDGLNVDHVMVDLRQLKTALLTAKNLLAKRKI